MVEELPAVLIGRPALPSSIAMRIMFSENIAIQLVPSACSAFTPVEDPDVIEAEEPPRRCCDRHPCDSPTRKFIQSVEDPLQEVEVLARSASIL